MKVRLAHHRHEERAELARLFNTGASVQMLAPRRIGKTWLMRKVAEDLTAEGWVCISVDAEGMRTEEEFLRALCKQIGEHQDLHKQLLSHVLHRLKRIKDGVTAGSLSQIIGQIDPKQFSENLIESLNAQPRKTLILIDEISLFVMERSRSDADGTRALLYHLRKLRQDNPRVVWLLTGSVGLDVVGRRLDLLGALTDLQIFGLEQFSIAAARSYIEDLCAQNQLREPLEFGDGAFDYLVRELGWLSPFYLELLAKRIRPSAPARAGRRAIAATTDIENAFSELLKNIYRTHFAAWEEHIKKNFPADQSRQLSAILNTLCENVDGEMDAALLVRFAQTFPNVSGREVKDLLSCLVNDGFLEKAGDRWRFRSGLLRRYWLEYIKA